MKLKNTLIVVKDIEKAKQFYYDLFGLETLTDNDGNMIQIVSSFIIQHHSHFIGSYPQILWKSHFYIYL